MRTRIAYGVTVLVAGLAGVGAAWMVSIATAGTFTLQIASHATVKPQTSAPVTEAIVVTSAQRAVYTLSSDSPRHPACTKAGGCWQFWPPVLAGRHPTAARGIKGKLTIWHHGGIAQLVLAGHPLYRFAGDSARDTANGEGITSFKGTWHVIRTSRSSSPAMTTPTSTTPTYTYTTPTYTYTTPTVPGY